MRRDAFDADGHMVSLDAVEHPPLLTETRRSQMGEFPAELLVVKRLIARRPCGPEKRTIAHQNAYFSATLGWSLSMVFAASLSSTIDHMSCKVYYP
jgi:hypothetical protein